MQSSVHMKTSANAINTWQKVLKVNIAPSFRLHHINTGKYVSSDEIITGISVLTFLPGIWAPWCRKLLAELDELAGSEEGQPFQFIAVISQNDDQLREYWQAHPYSICILADPSGAINTRYGIFDDKISEPMKISKPSILILDKHRRIHYKFMGAHLADRPNAEQIINYARRLHAETAPKPPRFFWHRWLRFKYA